MSKRLKKELTAAEVWEIRAENYCYHRDKRAALAYMDQYTRAAMIDLLSGLDRPKVGYLGTWEVTYWIVNYWRIAEKLGVGKFNILDMVIWYWTDEAWADYVAQFNALPDPPALWKVELAAWGKPVYRYIENCGKPVDNLVEKNGSYPQVLDFPQFTEKSPSYPQVIHSPVVDNFR